jgi:hypothetical protein
MPANAPNVPNTPNTPNAPSTEETTKKRVGKPKEKKTDPAAPKPKRGPARPHRRLALDVIESRITKLQKRLDRAKAQTEDAGRHVEGYLREREFRAKEGSNNSTTTEQ